ncbi:nuclear transport factor 2 family protein [Ruania alba]|uniref:SnoaL-like domain-containing protein n=1 Tax=Ruania alba TaxID=648782 RepID=A0A1H5CKG5_9MICO|nr:nuclear transport factor 2 family protein [Ruania alba]SED67081.1 SnoaL-like domain-containing protein [Ruania alba]
MDELASITRRLHHLESLEEIRDLAARYCWGADHRDADVWKSVWSPNAVWKVGPAREFVGLGEIQAAVRHQWAQFPRMQHATVNHRVTVSGDTATGTADVVVMTQLGQAFGGWADDWLCGGGTYQDEYVCLGGSWYLSRREATDNVLFGPTPTFDPAGKRP